MFGEYVYLFWRSGPDNVPVKMRATLDRGRLLEIAASYVSEEAAAWRKLRNLQPVSKSMEYTLGGSDDTLSGDELEMKLSDQETLFFKVVKVDGLATASGTLPADCNAANTAITATDARRKREWMAESGEVFKAWQARATESGQSGEISKDIDFGLGIAGPVASIVDPCSGLMRHCVRCAKLMPPDERQKQFGSGKIVCESCESEADMEAKAN